MKFTQTEILKALEHGFNHIAGEGEEISKNYVNPTAAALMTFADKPVFAPDGSLVSISKSDILTDFNRNTLITGPKAKERLKLIFARSAFFNKFKTIYGDELTIPIDISVSLKEQLISSTRAATQTGAASRDLMYVLGMELFLLNVELQKDISMKLIRNNLYNPNFEAEIDEALEIELNNDMLRLATNGYADSYDAIGEDFYTLAIGHEKILISSNGTWTNSNGTTLVTGYYGHFLTANKVDTANAGLTSATDKPTGQEVIKIFDLLLDVVPDHYAEDGFEGYEFVCARAESRAYANARSAPALIKSGGFGNVTSDVGVNTVTAVDWKTRGIVPMYEGIPIAVNPFKKKIGTAISGSEVQPNIYLAPVSREFWVGAQTKIELDRRYNPRSDGGGSAIEITKHFWIDFQVRNKEACAIAYYGAAVEAIICMNSADKKSTVITGGTNPTTFYPYCDTKDVRLFYADASNKLDDLADAVANGTEIEVGDAVVATATTYLRAFKDGYLTDSAVYTFTIA